MSPLVLGNRRRDRRFVGTHFLLSHPLRAPIVRAIGEPAFLGLYSLVAFATLGLARASRSARRRPRRPYWAVGDGLWITGDGASCYFASVLFVGSLLGNPALPDPTGTRQRRPPEPRGVFSVTRHPMMWGFALWGVAHILVMPTAAEHRRWPSTIIVLALVGAALQDRKKEQLQPDTWPRMGGEDELLAARRDPGRARQVHAGRGRADRSAGSSLWLAATWAHLPLAGIRRRHLALDRAIA